MAPLRDVVLVPVLSGLLSHFIVKKWETTNLWILVALLVILPLSVSNVFLPYYSPLQAAALSLLIHLSTLVSSIIVYRLSPIHPLSRYPGPTLLKLSKWPAVWIAIHGKQHFYYQSLHEQYGDVVRIGPNEIIIRDVSVAKPALSGQGLAKGPNWIGRTMNTPILPLIAHRNPVEHARRRKPWNRALNIAALKEYHPHVAGRVHQLVNLLAEKGTKPQDLARWIGYFTYDLMGDIMFGGGTELMRDGDPEGLWDIVEAGLGTAIIFEVVPWLPAFSKFIPSFGARLRVMRGNAIKRAQGRFKNGSARKDLFYYLSNEDGKEEITPPLPIVVSDGALALVAGSHTTSSVLANIIYLLLRYPRVHARLRQEIDTFYTREDDPTDPKHYAEMLYLDAVINETLRLFPAVPSGIQRAPILGTGDKMVGPYFVPEGTNVRIPIWSLHHDARNFSLPETFWPERWLIADGLEQPEADILKQIGELNHNLDAFVPFSHGAANCVGKSLAMQEMRVFVACVVHELDLRFADGWDPADWEREMQDMQTMKVGRLPVMVERRPLAK